MKSRRTFISHLRGSTTAEFQGFAEKLYHATRGGKTLAALRQVYNSEMWENQKMPDTEDALAARRDAFQKKADRNVFVIMQYGKDHEVLARAIRETLRLYGFEAKLASEMFFSGDLWQNIEFCMKHSRYAIVIFEGAEQPYFNPNVAVELGYMLALGKPCLLLKDQGLLTLPTDLVGRLYAPFDPQDIRGTVPPAIKGWLKKLGHERIRSVEEIRSHNDVEAKKQRTEAVTKALSKMKKGVARQAGSLSSLAISEREGVLEAEDPDLKEQLLNERRAMESLLRKGVIVRCLISPFVQIASLQLGVLSPEHIISDVIPRLEQLCFTLDAYKNCLELQVACTSRLPHDNVLIDQEGCRVFVGRRRLQQWGFPHTTIYHDPAIVRSEVERFDVAFEDAAAACLGKETAVLGDFGSSELKRKVIEHLQSCKIQLLQMTADVQEPTGSS